MNTKAMARGYLSDAQFFANIQNRTWYLVTDKSGHDYITPRLENCDGYTRLQPVKPAPKSDLQWR